jgi:hypothetical protein
MFAALLFFTGFETHCANVVAFGPAVLLMNTFSMGIYTNRIQITQEHRKAFCRWRLN